MAKKDGGASDIAAQDRTDEQTRQATIRQGTDRINQIFDGTPATSPVGTGTPDYGAYVTGNPDVLASFNKGDGHGSTLDQFGQWHWQNFGQAENAAGNPARTYTPYGVSGPGGATGGDAGSGSATDPLSGFNDAFYDKQRQNYIDYATPQLDDQYSDAQKQLTFALARGGNLDSSARADQQGQLQKKYDQNSQQIADQALSYENTARNNVEDARSQLISMLNTTGDASGAANQALSRATALSTPPSYSPLSNLFTDFTNGLGTQSALEQANAYSNGATGARYNTGLFAPSPNAVTVR